MGLNISRLRLPGANWLQNEGINLESLPRTTGASDATADANGLKLMVSAGTGIMLHYFGDPSTGNLATATAMELPMQKQFGAYQVFWKDAWRDIFSVVLDEDPEKDPAEIMITLPDIIEDDLQKLGTFLTALTGVFPEAKVPALLKQCLDSANVPDVDEVMKDIEANKDAIDAQTVLDKKTQMQHQLKLAKTKGAGANQGQDPSEQGTLMPDTPGGTSGV